MTFAQFDLNPLILKAISACGYTKPTPIQVKSVPDILLGKDIVASAQTGSGKTAAFVLPTLHNLTLSKQGPKPRVLILTPTRELATQINKATDIYGKYLGLKVVSLVGGMPYHQQLKNLSRPSDIIVATPGRLLDHMENRKIDLSRIEMLILDEADRMLDMGFIDDVKAIAKKTPQERQTLLFSATVDSRLKTVINQLLKNPVTIKLSNESNIPVHIKQELYRVDDAKHKMRVFQQLIIQENIYKAIIFSATKINADKLAKQLIDQGHSALALHGDLKQNVRNRNLDRLRSGKIQFLVATDVAARGIDVLDISHVINYDVPKFYEDYVHRIGRTGRAGKSGIAISLGLPEDARQIQRIEKHTSTAFEVKAIAGLEPKKQSTKPASKPPAKKKRRFDKPFDKAQGKKKTFQNPGKKPGKIRKHKPTFAKKARG
jgi:superfamily II DNA/RNA helicase